MATSTGDLTLDDAWEYAVTAWQLAWARTTRRMRVAGVLLITTLATVLITWPSLPQRSELPTLPKISLRYSAQAGSFNASKVALLIEDRATPFLAPLMLHFMAVVPPDWRFRFMGSLDSVALVNTSCAIRQHVESGKLDLTYIPANMSVGSQEETSRTLTTLWLYETVLQPAEWLLVYQTDSMLCANSRQSLNNFLEYDWVGAPWSRDSRFGGNGGLSLRRVSAIIDVLRHQVRAPNSEPEDVWLTDRLGHRPGARLANGTASLTFSGENLAGELEHVGRRPPGGGGGGGGHPDSAGSKAGSHGKPNAPAAAEHGEFTKAGALVKGIDDWRDGHYEPMGYHTGRGGTDLHPAVFGTPALRAHLWRYCPEIKMMLRMDAARYVPGQCHASWRRWLVSEEGEEGKEGGEAAGFEGQHRAEDGSGVVEDGSMELIDGVLYPRLPAGLQAW